MKKIIFLVISLIVVVILYVIGKPLKTPHSDIPVTTDFYNNTWYPEIKDYLNDKGEEVDLWLDLKNNNIKYLLTKFANDDALSETQRIIKGRIFFEKGLFYEKFAKLCRRVKEIYEERYYRKEIEKKRLNNKVEAFLLYERFLIFLSQEGLQHDVSRLKARLQLIRDLGIKPFSTWAVLWLELAGKNSPQNEVTPIPWIVQSYDNLIVGLDAILFYYNRKDATLLFEELIENEMVKELIRTAPLDIKNYLLTRNLFCRVKYLKKDIADSEMEIVSAPLMDIIASEGDYRVSYLFYAPEIYEILAIDSFQRAISIFSVPGLSNLSGHASIYMGMAFYHLGEFQKAVGFLAEGREKSGADNRYILFSDFNNRDEHMLKASAYLAILYQYLNQADNLTGEVKAIIDYQTEDIFAYRQIYIAVMHLKENKLLRDKFFRAYDKARNINRASDDWDEDRERFIESSADQFSRHAAEVLHSSGKLYDAYRLYRQTLVETPITKPDKKNSIAFIADYLTLLSSMREYEEVVSTLDKRFRDRGWSEVNAVRYYVIQLLAMEQGQPIIPGS